LFSSQKTWQDFTWCASADCAYVLDVTAHGGYPYAARIRTGTVARSFLEKPASFCTK
jgi:hypothetical protein